MSDIKYPALIAIMLLKILLRSLMKKIRGNENKFMPKFKDLTGMKINRWKILENLGKNKYNQYIYRCICECGTIKIVTGGSISGGTSKSCGCIQKESLKNTGHKNKKYNKYDLNGEYGIGYTFKNMIFYFDLSDYELIKDCCWYIGNDGYVTTRNYKENKLVLMHRLLFDFPDFYIDHNNQDKFDNRRINLRKATIQENLRNSTIKSTNTTGFIGICFRKKYKKYGAAIKIDGKSKYLGQFDNIYDAIVARLRAEKKYFGEFAPQRYLFKEYGIND